MSEPLRKDGVQPSENSLQIPGDSSDSIQLACQCGRILVVPLAAQGKIAACPECSHQMPVPVRSDSSIDSLDPPAVSQMIGTREANADLTGGFSGTRSDMSAVRQAVDINPYSPALGDLEADGTSLFDDVDEVRRFYLSHESRVIGMGWLFILGAIGILISAIYTYRRGAVLTSSVSPVSGISVPMFGLMVVFAAIHLFVGLGLRKLNNTARIAAVVLSCLNLVNLPVGPFISVYFLYLLLSTKGLMVFSAPYQQVRAATPHIRYATPTYVWVTGVILAVLLGSLVLLRLF